VTVPGWSAAGNCRARRRRACTVLLTFRMEERSMLFMVLRVAMALSAVFLAAAMFRVVRGSRS
jgi:hypothetical protein